MNGSNLTRREFLMVAAASLITTSAGELSEVHGEAKPWYVEMRRCRQINFNEATVSNVHIKSAALVPLT